VDFRTNSPTMYYAGSRRLLPIGGMSARPARSWLAVSQNLSDYASDLSHRADRVTIERSAANSALLRVAPLVQFLLGNMPLVNERHLRPVEPLDGACGLGWPQVAAVTERRDQVAFVRIFELGVMPEMGPK
jgi:hypothetical protein